MYFDYEYTSEICLPSANVECLKYKQIREREM